MRIFVTVLLASLVLSGCQSAPPKEKKPDKEPVSDTLTHTGEWQGSSLSEQSIRRINELNVKYRRCLQAETDARAATADDPRAIGDLILRQCEDTLGEIQAALEAEGVPNTVAARYVRKNRSQGAQNVMRVVQFVQAQRAADHEETLRSRHAADPVR